MNPAMRVATAVVAVVVTVSGAAAQSTPAPEPTTDIFDVWRAFRHKEKAPDAAWDYHKTMKAFAPVIGVKPSSGALIGVAGNIAFYRGDPATTRISSMVASLTF